MNDSGIGPNGPRFGAAVKPASIAIDDRFVPQPPPPPPPKESCTAVHRRLQTLAAGLAEDLRHLPMTPAARRRRRATLLQLLADVDRLELGALAFRMHVPGQPPMKLHLQIEDSIHETWVENTLRN